MNILVTGFNGKVGKEVAKNLKAKGLSIKCAVRNVDSIQREQNAYDFVSLDFTNPKTFDNALNEIDKLFLIYPPGTDIKFEEFLNVARQKKVKHIVYLSVKDVQFLPFIHHYKNEKLIKKSGIPFTFIRAGYFMQNLNDFLGAELRENRRIFVPAGKGKTSFVDTRDLAEVASIAFQNTEEHQNKKYVITGDEALDFYEVAEMMTDVMHVDIHYTNHSVKEFRECMLKKGEKEQFINVVVGIHFPTKLGLAKGITDEYEKLTKMKSRKMKNYIMDYQEEWV